MTFTNNHYTPEDISASFPVQVTITDHGLSSGKFMRATQFIVIPFDIATGMEQLNNRLFQIYVNSVDTFLLLDQYGNGIDGRDYTPFTGDGNPQLTLTGPDLFIQNTA